MRVLYFGDGVWATRTLRALSRDTCQILGVVLRTQPSDPELLKVAEALQLPVMQPRRVNDPDFVAQVEAIGPDLNISVSYDQILRHAILDSAPKGFINFHGGMLPSYRGRNIINWAIINDEKEIGLTAHYVDEGIDTGDIIQQCSIPIEWTDTYGDMLHKIYALFPEFVVETVQAIAEGKAQRKPQAHLPGTYFARRGPGDEWLDWSDTSRNLYNKIRAITHPGPGACTWLDSQVITIWQAYYDPEWPKYVATPGQVVGRRSGEGIVVKTGDSTLLVQRVQTGGEDAHMPNWPISTRLGLNVMSYIQQLQNRIEQLEKQAK